MSSNNMIPDIQLSAGLDPNSTVILERSMNSLMTRLRKDAMVNIGVQGNLQDFAKVTQMLGQLESSAKRVQMSLNSSAGTFNGKEFAAGMTGVRTSMNQLIQGGKLTSDSLAALPVAFNKIGEASKTMQQASTRVEQTRHQTDSLGKALDALGKTALWSTMNRGFDMIMRKAQESITFIKKLDESLNQIQLVSGLSSSAVADIGVEANKVARELGQTTTAYTDAAMLYLQQGKSLGEAQKLAESTLVATNITGEKSAHVVELMTAAMNGYNLEASDAMRVLDSFAAVGAATASDFNELAVGFSKVAAMAKTTGVEFDQLNSMIATVASATREAPETIGTSFKTIFARMSSLRLGEDEEGNYDGGAELAKYAAQVKEVANIDFFDADGQLKEMGFLVEEVGNQWEGLSKNAKIIIAEAMAGTRQASRLHALFNSWDDYESTRDLSKEENSAGAAMEQNEIRMDSLKAAANQLQASWENLFTKLFNRDDMEGFYKTLTSIVDRVAEMVEMFGGLGPIIGMAFAPLMGRALGSGLTKTLDSAGNRKEFKEQGSSPAKIYGTAAFGSKKDFQKEIDKMTPTQLSRMTKMDNADIENYYGTNEALERIQKEKVENEIARTNSQQMAMAANSQRTKGYFSLDQTLQSDIIEKGLVPYADMSRAAREVDRNDARGKNTNAVHRSTQQTGREVAAAQKDVLLNSGVATEESLKGKNIASEYRKLSPEKLSKLNDYTAANGPDVQALEKKILEYNSKIQALGFTDDQLSDFAKANLEFKDFVAQIRAMRAEMSHNSEMVKDNILSEDQLDQDAALSEPILEAKDDIADNSQKLEEARAKVKERDEATKAQTTSSKDLTAMQKTVSKAETDLAAAEKLLVASNTKLSSGAAVAGGDGSIGALKTSAEEIVRLEKTVTEELEKQTSLKKQLTDENKKLDKMKPAGEKTGLVSVDTKSAATAANNLEEKKTDLSTHEYNSKNTSRMTGNQAITAMNQAFKESELSPYGLADDADTSQFMDGRKTEGKLTKQLIGEENWKKLKGQKTVSSKDISKLLPTKPVNPSVVGDPNTVPVEGLPKKLVDQISGIQGEYNNTIAQINERDRLKAEVKSAEAAFNAEMEKANEQLAKATGKKQSAKTPEEVQKKVEAENQAREDSNKKVDEANQARVASENKIKELNNQKTASETKYAEMTRQKNTLSNSLAGKIGAANTEIPSGYGISKISSSALPATIIKNIEAMQGTINAAQGKINTSTVDLEASVKRKQEELEKARQILDKAKAQNAAVGNSDDLDDEVARLEAEAKALTKSLENLEKKQQKAINGVASTSAEATAKVSQVDASVKGAAKNVAAVAAPGSVVGNTITEANTVITESNAMVAVRDAQSAALDESEKVLKESSNRFVRSAKNALTGDGLAKTATTLSSIGMAMPGIVNAFDALASGEVSSGISGLAQSFGMIGMMAGGPVIKAISGISMIVSAFLPKILDWLDTTKNLEKSNAAVVDRYKEQTAELKSQKQMMVDVSKSHASVMEDISAAGGMNSASEDQIAALKEVQNQIAALDSSTVAYYDNAGNAVLNHNLKLDDQIAKLDELIAAQDSIMLENREGFLTEGLVNEAAARKDLEYATEEIKKLQSRMEDLDPSSRKYLQYLDDIRELNIRVAESQDILKNSSENLKTNVIDIFRSTNEVMKGTDDTAKSFVSGFVTEDRIKAQMAMLEAAAARAEEHGGDLEELGLDAKGQAKILDQWITDEENKMKVVADGLAVIRSSADETDKKFAQQLANTDLSTKNYIANLASLTSTASGAASMMRELAGSMNEYGVISATFSPRNSLATALAADVSDYGGRSDLEAAKVAEENAWANAQPRKYQDKVEAARLRNSQMAVLSTNKNRDLSNTNLVEYVDKPVDSRPQATSAVEAMDSNRYRNHYDASGLTSQREVEEYNNSADPAALAATQERKRIEDGINESIERRVRLLKDEAALNFQLEQSRSNYYLDLASTEEGHNKLASTYSQDYNAVAPLMSSAYKEEEVNKFDYNSSNGVSMTPDEQAVAKEETVTITTETDFGDTVDDFDNMISDLLESSTDFGGALSDHIADAMGMAEEEVETSIDRMAEILQGEGMIDALAGTNEELKGLLQEFAEEGANASDEAIAAAYDAADSRIQAQGEMYAAMRANDTGYWAQVVQLNQDEVNLTTATTGIKVQDYTTYAEYKGAMRQWEAENAGWLANSEVATAVWSNNEQIMDAARKTADVMIARGDEEGAKAVIAEAETKTQENAENAKIAMGWETAAQMVKAGGTALKIIVQNFQSVFKGIAALPGVDGIIDGFLGGIDAMSAGISEDFMSQASNVTNSFHGSGSGPGEDGGADWQSGMQKPGGSGANRPGSSGGVDHDINLLPGSKPPEWSGSKPTAPPSGLGGSNSAPSGGGDSGGGDKGGGGDKDGGAGKEQEDMEWEKDWYHDINVLIDKNADAIKKLSEIEERTYGEQRLKNMRQQATLLQEQYSLKLKGLEIAKQEAAHYKSLISAQGASFNKDGSLSDYNGFIQGKVNAANSIADADAKKEAQDSVKDLIDDIEAYEKALFETVRDFEDAAEEARQEAQDKILEALEYEFEIVLKVKQVIIDDNDFLNDFLEGLETADKVIDRLVESGMAQKDSLFELGNQFKATMDLDLDPGPKIEKLEELKEEFIEAFETMKDLNDAISDALIEAIDRNIEALDYAFAELEHITETAGNMIELNDLFGHKEDYEAIVGMMDTIAKANTLQLDTMVKSKKELEGYRDALEEGTEEWKAANDAVLEMDSSIQDMTIETIKLYREQLSTAFNGIMNDIEKAMSGNQTLDKLRKDINLVREEQARYADTIDQTIFKQNMLNKIQADIASTTDPKKQAELQKFYDEQVATLGEKGKLLESELTRTEMLYDITLAQMALDDARANKSVMKLTRDSQGNWGYEYMADMAAIEGAQDALSQKLNDLMAFDKQQFEATQDFILQKRDEYLMNMRELNEMYMNGEFESEAEYQAAMDALTQDFNDEMLQLEVDYNDLKLNLNESTLSTLMGKYIDFSGSSEEIWQQMYDAMLGMSAEELALLEDAFGLSLENIGSMTEAELEDLKKKWGDAYLDINDKTGEGLGILENSWETMRNTIADKITNPETGINKYLQDYAAKVAEIAKLTGYTDLANSSNGLKDASEKLSSQLDKEKKKHEELHAAMKKEFDAIKDAVKAGGPLDQLKKAYESIRKEIEAYIKKLNEAIAKQKEIGNSKPTTGTPGNGSSGSTTKPPAPPKPTTPPKPSGPQGNGKLDKGDKVRVKSQGTRAFLDSAGTIVRPWADQASAAGIPWNAELYVVNVGNGKGALSKTNNINGAIAWLNSGDLSGFETGGYTGAFGNQGGSDGKNGKLALLHEKELVLNKHDTANMLSAISMIRDIYSAPNLNLGGAGSGVQQSVQINADFSGVRNSAEIENAFENLLNKAIQYTNIKK